MALSAGVRRSDFFSILTEVLKGVLLMHLLRVLLVMFGLCVYTGQAFALPFELNNIDWNTRYTDYSQNFINGQVITGSFAREEDKDTIYFKDARTGAFDKIAGRTINKITYGFFASTAKLKKIEFRVGFSSNVQKRTIGEIGGWQNIEYPLSAVDSTVVAFCTYFSKSLGPYEKFVTDNDEEPTFDNVLQCYISHPKTIFYEWHALDTYVSMCVDTTKLAFTNGKRQTSQVIIVQIADRPIYD